MQGVVFIIDQLGQTIVLRDKRIAELVAENDQLKAQLTGKVATDEQTAGSGDD